MHRLLPFFLVFGLLAGPALRANEPAQWLARSGAENFPGVAFAVVENGETTRLETAGELELGAGEPIAAETPFLVGSISKSFTALAIMQLVEAGKVDLDAPLSRYLPRFAGKPSGRVTIHRLLNHTSGFATAQGNATQTDLAEDDEALARRVDGLLAIDPADPPGSTHRYSNANYQLLGRIVETVSGQSYAEYVEQNILAPAGMEDSFVHPSPRSVQLAQGHRPWFGGFRALEANLTGAGSAPQGGIAASARDMALYLSLMMNGEDDILSAEGKARMVRSDDPAAPEYGYGWAIDRETGRVWHAGANAGYDAMVAMLPEQGKGAVVLLNAGSGLAFGRTGDLRLGLTSAALGLEEPPAADATPFQVVFVILCILPFLFVFGIYRAWRKRRRERRKGAVPALRLWVPVFMAFALAWGLAVGLPGTFGTGLGATMLFVPDFGLLLAASAAAAVAWALARIVFRPRAQ